MLVLSLVTQRSNYISFCYSVSMDLEFIKELLLSPRPSEEYLAGVAGFLDFAYIGKSSDAKIRCPCVILCQWIVTEAGGRVRSLGL